MPTPRPINPATNTTNPSTRAGQLQNPFLGSTPQPPAPDTALTISLGDAVRRGLQYNLGLIDASTSSAAARAARLRALSSLLPTVTARAAKVWEELSLREFGLTLPGLPSTTGNFGFTMCASASPSRSTTASCGIATRPMRRPNGRLS